jgi:hypothetical protein
MLIWSFLPSLETVLKLALALVDPKPSFVDIISNLIQAVPLKRPATFLILKPVLYLKDQPITFR